MFHLHPLAHGLIADRSADPWPTRVRGWLTNRLELADEGTHFGYVCQPTCLRCASGDFRLREGMYFAVPGDLVLERGAGLVVSRLGHRGLFHLGGPIEQRGRLRYIDGCTDALLIPPVLRGDPCLNLLHVPSGTSQTAHTHPSLRVGLIVKGSGECRTPQGGFPLEASQVFLIEADTPHAFHTVDNELLIVAYHPDSDFGPTHEDHPMRNRTIIR